MINYIIILLLLTSNVDPTNSLNIQNYNFPPEQYENIDQFLKNSIGSNYEISQEFISFSNKNFKIFDRLTNDYWVLRIPNEISNLLSNRTQEKYLINWAWNEGISLIEIKDFDADTGYLLTRFISGQTCSAIDFQDPVKLEKCVKLLYTLHGSKTAPISTQFHLLDRYKITSKIAEKNGYHLPIEVHQAACKLSELLELIPKACFYYKPCHNDPSPENFFVQLSTIYLHDWELASRNDPMWDLTHLSVLAQIQPEKILNFYKSTDPFALDKMNVFKPFIFFNTVVWASLERLQKSSSLSEQNTELLYNTYLEKITESIESQSFRNSLNNLIKGDHL